MATDPLTAAIDDGLPLVVLSPHLDDAVLSCGALMMHASRRVPVTVVTFFTEAGHRPYTLSARRYLRQVGEPDAQTLYRDRRAEDRAVLDRLGVSWRHLGLTEGLFRRRTRPATRRARIAGRILPELDHVYPTYRLHLASGRIAADDTGTLRSIQDAVESLAAGHPGLLLAPSAVGGNVDHLLVRAAVERAGTPAAFYSDFPYNQHHAVDPGFARRTALVETVWERELAAKASLVKAYRTQVGAMFPRGVVPLVPEIYLLASHSFAPDREGP